MSSKTCALPGCNNLLNKGKKYCSTKCSAIGRSRKSAVITAGHDILDDFPAELTSGMVEMFGTDAAKAISLEVVQLLQDESIPLPSPSNSVGDWALSFDGRQSWRPNDKLSFDKIELIKRCGAAMFAVEMKRGMAGRNFSEGRFVVESPDKELASVAMASCNDVLPRMVDDITHSSFIYGAYFGEKQWERKTKYQLGLTNSKSGFTSFVVPKVPNSVKPTTIDHIRTLEKGQKFNGFVQNNDVDSAAHGVIAPDATAGKSSTGINDIIISRDAALVVPFNGRFRNLWGESILTRIYPIWLWYEIILRTMARYMERMAMPVAVGKAPLRRTVRVEGKDNPVRAMDLMMAVATSIAKSNAAVIPSDLDENGNKQYDLAYLTAQERGEQFITILGYLNEEMSRGVVVADRSIMQSGGIGSKNIGEVHAQSTAIHNLLIELEILYYINRYWMPYFSIYNRGVNGPPIRLKTQNADEKERELVMKLMAITGNSEAGKMFQERIDYGELGELSHIPMLSEQEAEANMEKRFDKNLEHQERQQSLMQKFNVNKDGNPQYGGIPPKEKPKETDEQKKEKAEEKSKNMELIFDALVRGERLPIVFGDRELEVMGVAE